VLNGKRAAEFLKAHLEKGLCRLGFVRIAIRSSVTLAGDTYRLNCSGFLPNGRTSSQTNESGTNHTPSDSNLKIRYDKFKDVTYVSTNDLMIDGVDSVANKRPPQLTMVLSYFCHGNTQNCSPRTMGLVFVGKTSFWEYKSTHDLVFILDGKRMSVPRPDWEGKVMSADDLREYMDCQISPESIRRLAAASDVEGELGFTAFKLNQDHLSALRTLLKDVHRPTPETH